MSPLNEQTYKSFFVTGSGPGILYGLPKTHKSDFADSYHLRPIFAAYNCASYKLSKFFVRYFNYTFLFKITHREGNENIA